MRVKAPQLLSVSVAGLSLLLAVGCATSPPRTQPVSYPVHAWIAQSDSPGQPPQLYWDCTDLEPTGFLLTLMKFVSTTASPEGSLTVEWTRILIMPPEPPMRIDNLPSGSYGVAIFGKKMPGDESKQVSNGVEFTIR